MPTFGSLFAGIGGIDLGLERAGWTGRWQVEYEPFCQRVLAKHWPDVTRYGDIRDVDWAGVEPVDAVVGGFPCQPISSAGNQQAQADERWLWPEFLRCIRALRPRYVLVENVTNLLAVNNGSAFGDVLGDLAASGYDAEWDCIPASAVGALHERDRVWVLAYPNRGGLEVQRVAQPTRFAGARRDQPDGCRPLRELDHATLPHPERRDGEAFDQGRLLAEPGRQGPAERPLDGDLPRDGQWSTEPGVGRLVDGFPDRVAHLRALGNAVVPQVVEFIGRRILEAEGLT